MCPLDSSSGDRDEDGWRGMHSKDGDDQTLSTSLYPDPHCEPAGWPAAALLGPHWYRNTHTHTLFCTEHTTQMWMMTFEVGQQRAFSVCYLKLDESLCFSGLVLSLKCLVSLVTWCHCDRLQVFSSNPTQVFLHQLVHCITNPCSSGFTLPVRRSLWGRSLTFYNPQTVILTLDQIYGGNISWFPSDVLQLLCLMNRLKWSNH